MSVIKRPLGGIAVNLSISESEDSVRRGFPKWQVNRVTLQFVSAFIGQGTSVVFGHDWREDGVMEAVHGFALQIQPPVPMTPMAAEGEDQPLLRNVIPWPESPHLSETEQEKLGSTLRIELAGLPAGLGQYDLDARAAGPRSPLFQYLRARGLTFFRHRLNEVCHARLCAGGRRVGFQGRYPGVIEEALLAVQGNKPLYVASILGGASEQVVEAIEGKQMPGDFCVPNPMERLYQQPPVNEANLDTRSDRTVDGGAVWHEFAEKGREGISVMNGLLLRRTTNSYVRAPSNAQSNWSLPACREFGQHRRK